MADVVAVVPVLGRPWRVEPLIEALAASLEQTTVELLFVASPGDDAEIAELESAGARYLVADRPAGPGDWARKVNLGYRATDAPWIFTGADDLCFCPGWADRALECAMATAAGVVGTNDCANERVIRGDHATHNLVARWYADTYGTVDGPGAVVTEVYAHNYVDDELVQTARTRGKWKFCRASEVPHMHPNFDRSVRIDDTYRLGESRFTADRVMFMRRRPLFR